MRATGKRRSGQPMVVLGTLLVGWVFLRVALWESPFPDSLAAQVQSPVVQMAQNAQPSALAENGRLALNSMAASPLPISTAPIAPPKAVGVDYPPVKAVGEPEVQGFASQQLLWLAAMGKVPVPGEILSAMRDSARAAPAAPTAAPFGGLSAGGLPKAGAADGASPKRWSADGWLFLRAGPATASSAGTRYSSYGASQAGAVLRYRLDPASRNKPSVYLRATKALATSREADLAFGVSARPIAKIPVSAHAEMRLTRQNGRQEMRPAAFLVTELPPAGLPYGMRGETYAQAGYVGGNFKTAFIDGQAKLDRAVARFDLGTLRAGAGAWGGAQKGAARVDIGPTASVETLLGDMPARIIVDYRMRVAGDAKPGSGVALTLTTGF